MLQKPPRTEPSVEFSNQMKNYSHKRVVSLSNAPHEVKRLTVQMQSPAQRSSPVFFPPYRKWFTHDNGLSLRTQGMWQWHPLKQNKNLRIWFLLVKNTVLFPTNVSFDNTLFTVVCVKGQHLKGTNAHLTASVYMQTVTGKRSNSCGTWNELFRIQFWVDPS